MLLAVPAGLQAIPWVLAAKTVARYPAIDHRGLRSEQYVLGTLLSTTLATIGVLLIRLALGIPLLSVS